MNDNTPSVFFIVKAVYINRIRNRLIQSPIFFVKDCSGILRLVVITSSDKRKRINVNRLQK